MLAARGLPVGLAQQLRVTLSPVSYILNPKTLLRARVDCAYGPRSVRALWGLFNGGIGRFRYIAWVRAHTDLRAKRQRSARVLTPVAAPVPCAPGYRFWC